MQAPKFFSKITAMPTALEWFGVNAKWPAFKAVVKPSRASAQGQVWILSGVQKKAHLPTLCLTRHSSGLASPAAELQR
jgi:hypothetical protein